ncbi:hypothetical protein EON65_02630 [archaeon]|nr:MAG: hypothetical protein EON65_02630 [archaeon]
MQAQQDRYEQAVDRDVREVQGRGGSGLRGSRSSGLGGIGGEGGGSQQSREGRLVPGRSESPLFESAHRSAERASSVDRENEGRRRRGELERELQDEIQILDDQIGR